MREEGRRYRGPLGRYSAEFRGALPVGHPIELQGGISDLFVRRRRGYVTFDLEARVDGEVVQRHTGRHASPDNSVKIQLPTQDGGWVNVTRSGSALNPARLRRLAEWMDEHGLAQDLLDEKYQDMATVQADAVHTTDVLANFMANMPQEDLWQGGQERDFPWGAIRTMDDIMGDPHLEDRGFFVQVEHSELGQSFTYPGAAAIYNGSPWNISRRAPLIGEHNQEIYCGELGLTTGELTLLAQSSVI